MEHAIGGPNRNWFATDKGCRDGKEFEKLVELGFATAEMGPFGNCETVYRVTVEGKKELS